MGDLHKINPAKTRLFCAKGLRVYRFWRLLESCTPAFGEVYGVVVASRCMFSKSCCDGE